MASNVVQAWGASAQVTITLSSLASDGNLLAGRQSDAVDLTSFNSGNILDVALTGFIKANATPPTAGGFIEIWAIAPIEDTPTWPDAFSTSDANRTVLARSVLQGYAKKLWSQINDATADRLYYVGDCSIRGAFGGVLPKQVVIWVVQSTNQALNVTASTSKLYLKPVYETVG